MHQTSRNALTGWPASPFDSIARWHPEPTCSRGSSTRIQRFGAGGARSVERSAHCVGGDARVDRHQRIWCTPAFITGSRRPMGGWGVLPGRIRLRGTEAAEQSSQPWAATTWTLNSLREWGSTPVFCGSVVPQNCSRKTVAGSTRAGRTGTVRSIAASTPGRWQTVCGSMFALMNSLIGLCGINFRMVGGTASGSKVDAIVVSFDAQFTQRASRVRDRDRGNG